MRKLVVFVLVILLSGCANPINRATANNYFQMGEESLKRGNLVHAKKMFSRALLNARLGNLGAEAEAQVLMKLGRTLGNMCEYSEAESSFKEAISLYTKVYGNTSPNTFYSKVELGQLNYDIGSYEKATIYFEKALAVGRKALKGSNPTTYYEILKDYADALSKSKDLVRAEEINTELSANLNYLDGESNYVRYPTVCN